jgi:prepilin-type N-terminal cleavage/methylation domain-containing protein
VVRRDEIIVRIERCYGVRRQNGAAKPFSALRRAVLHRTGETPVPLTSRAFTLVELILVMALLVIGVSFISPQLGGFFRGRTLNSEARQIISMAHAAQSRAVSGGVPVILWIDKDKNSYGIQEEPGYTDKDPKAEEYAVNENLKIEIPDDDTIAQPTEMSSDPHMNLPHVTFLPDGTIADGSPKTITLVDNNGPKVSVTQSRDRSQYEIATTQEQ